MRTSKGSVFPTCYNKELATVSCVLAESQRQAEEQESSIVEKGKLQVCPDGMPLAWRSWKRAN